MAKIGNTDKINCLLKLCEIIYTENRRDIISFSCNFLYASLSRHFLTGFLKKEHLNYHLKMSKGKKLKMFKNVTMGQSIFLQTNNVVLGLEVIIY